MTMVYSHAVQGRQFMVSPGICRGFPFPVPLKPMRRGTREIAFLPFSSSSRPQCYLYTVSLYTVISVRSWNFKDGGSLKASFLAKNQHGTKEKSLKKSYE